YSKHPERNVSCSIENPMPPPSRYYPMQRWSLSDIKQHAGETVLLDLAPDKLEMLQQAGYRTTLHTYGGIVVVFLE
ncbi:MAG: hypothetical protein JWP63_7078, partial [Candidatus Solibacter sp.]|nr:hypothetical protein [Candidatus Solibacter sp.]